MKLIVRPSTLPLLRVKNPAPAVREKHPAPAVRAVPAVPAVIMKAERALMVI